MNAPIRIYVPRDAALAVDADAVARAIEVAAEQRGLAVQLVRNGSRGLLWLEPMVEIATPAGRVAYGPVQPEDVAGLFEAGWLQGGAHPLRLGPTEDIPYLKHQERLTFARVGVTDPLSLQDYAAHGGLEGLKRALSLAPEAIVQELIDSGLRGRGGAAFPTGIKWKTVAGTPADQKYIVCNADEGDSGTYADRLLMEGDPYVLIEGMTIAGLAVGATQGYIYVRSEYPHAIAALEAAIARAREVGWLGADVHGSGRRFDLEVRKGAGAYICGERPRCWKAWRASAAWCAPAAAAGHLRPVRQAHRDQQRHLAGHGAHHPGQGRGLLPRLWRGPLARHPALPTGRQPQARRAGGKGLGLTLRDLLYGFGGGSASGRPLRAVQVGGPLGAYLPESQWDVPLDYEAYARISAMIGHGGLVAFDDTVDMARMARYAMEFCAVESCGKCTPCRIGSTRGVETLDKIMAGGPAREQQVHLLRDLCDTMLGGSLCALGGMAPYPVLSALNHFPQDFGLADSPAPAASAA